METELNINNFYCYPILNSLEDNFYINNNKEITSEIMTLVGDTNKKYCIMAMGPQSTIPESLSDLTQSIEETVDALIMLIYVFEDVSLSIYGTDAGENFKVGSDIYLQKGWNYIFVNTENEDYTSWILHPVSVENTNDYNTIFLDDDYFNKMLLRCINKEYCDIFSGFLQEIIPNAIKAGLYKKENSEWTLKHENIFNVGLSSLTE